MEQNCRNKFLDLSGGLARQNLSFFAKFKTSGFSIFFNKYGIMTAPYISYSNLFVSEKTDPSSFSTRIWSKFLFSVRLAVHEDCKYKRLPGRCHTSRGMWQWRFEVAGCG